MGKNTTKNQKKKLAKARKKLEVKLNYESLTISELLTLAQKHIDSFQYENAQIFCQEALKRDPDHVTALETSASLCLEVGNLDGAKHCLGRAITIQPEEGHTKYLSMAQLLDGKESLQCYLKGMELIQSAVSSLQEVQIKANTSAHDQIGMSNVKNEVDMAPMSDEETVEGKLEEAVEERENEPPSTSSMSLEQPLSLKSTLIRLMSSVHCSVAELFMTDLCNEDDAETQCQNNIDKAIEVDPTNPEAHQIMASYLLVKQDEEQAKVYITKSLELWLPKYKAVDEGEAAVGTFDPVEVCPLSYSTRLSTAKILIEVEDHEHAIEVLEGLAEENDTVVDTWYLMGWSSYLRGEEHKENARYLLHRAMQAHETSPSNDVQLIEHLEELLAELGPLPEGQEPEESDIDDELEDSDDENEEQGMDTN